MFPQYTDSPSVQHFPQAGLPLTPIPNHAPSPLPDKQVEAGPAHYCLQHNRRRHREAPKNITILFFPPDLICQYIEGCTSYSGNVPRRNNSIQDLYRHYDIILTPNGEGIAPFLNEAKQVEYTLVDDFLIVANLAGLPSLTLPCGFVDHMPVAIHIMGRCFEEQTVLNCAYALEKSLSFSQQYCQKEIQHV